MALGRLYSAIVRGLVIPRARLGLSHAQCQLTDTTLSEVHLARSVIKLSFAQAAIIKNP